MKYDAPPLIRPFVKKSTSLSKKWFYYHYPPNKRSSDEHAYYTYPIEGSLFGFLFYQLLRFRSQRGEIYRRRSNNSQLSRHILSLSRQLLFQIPARDPSVNSLKSLTATVQKIGYSAYDLYSIPIFIFCKSVW